MTREIEEAIAVRAWRDAQATYYRRQKAPTGPMVNLCADGGFLCAACVESEKERIADVDPDCPDDDQWRILGKQYAEDDDTCSHCGRTIT